ncbi:hypothetical protein KJ680_02205, partial [bacterium]|nr:hypothetical protein [bacterium]
MPKIYQKIISIFLLTAILLGPGYFFKPKKTDAALNAGAGLLYCLKGRAARTAATAKAAVSSVSQAMVVPVGERPSKPQITTTAVMTSGIEETEFNRCIREYVLNPIAWFIAKTIIRQFTKGIVNWINSGFEGNPTFVDPDTFLTDVADQASGAFIKQLGLEGILCSPFRLPILASLELSYRTSTLPRFQCTLGAAKENWQRNWDEFMYDFTNGGWDRWLNVTTQPQNNPYGAYLMAYDELQARRLAAQEKKKTEVSWGSGFVSLQECSGDINQDKMCDTQCGHLEDSDDCFNNCMAIVGWDDKLSSAEKCKLSGEQMQNTTPGKIIQDQLSQTLGTDLRQLELADEFNEIITALIGQIFNWGSRGLRGQKDVVENADINKDIYIYQEQEYAQQAVQEAGGIIQGVEKEET